MNLFVGEIVSIRDGDDGRTGTLRVRGARVEVALDLVPAARVGDSVLVSAGVAVSLMAGDEEGRRCV